MRVRSVGDAIAASWNESLPTTSGWPLPMEIVRLLLSPGVTLALTNLFSSSTTWSRWSSRSFGGRVADEAKLEICSLSLAICVP